MWKSDLAEIAEFEAKRGRELNTGASDEDIRVLDDKSVSTFGAHIPSEYAQLLKTINGFEFNGHILYGVDEDLLKVPPNQNINGFIDMNETWKDNGFDDYLFIGQHDISWFVYSVSEGSFLELDLPSGDKLVNFTDFDSLLDMFFERALL